MSCNPSLHLHKLQPLLYTIPLLVISSHYLQVPALAKYLVAKYSSGLLLYTIPLLNLSSSPKLQPKLLDVTLACYDDQTTTPIW